VARDTLDAAAVIVNFLGDVYDWFTDSDQWSGTAGIPHRLFEHVQLSSISVLVALIIAIPIGVMLGHVRRGGNAAVIVSNMGRAIPSFGILVLLVQVLGIGAGPTFVALLLLAIPPMLTNAYVGVADVDDDLRDAARGMGMTRWQMLWRVELPVASPLLMAGVRTAAVTVVATASLAAVVAWGGLGRFVVDGIAQGDEAQTFGGAVLIGGLAILTEVALALSERVIVPKPMRRTARVRSAAAIGTLDPSDLDVRATTDPDGG
jgi:osmoprotectant transport system permease protein